MLVPQEEKYIIYNKRYNQFYHWKNDNGIHLHRSATIHYSDLRYITETLYYILTDVEMMVYAYNQEGVAQQQTINNVEDWQIKKLVIKFCLRDNDA